MQIPNLSMSWPVCGAGPAGRQQRRLPPERPHWQPHHEEPDGRHFTGVGHRLHGRVWYRVHLWLGA